MGLLPNAPFLPSDLRGKPGIFARLCHTGGQELAQREVDEWRSLEKAKADLVQPTTFPEFLYAADRQAWPPIRQYWDSRHFADVTPELISLLAAEVAKLGAMKAGGFRTMALFPYRGAMSRRAQAESCYSLREGWELPIMAFWQDPAEDAVQRGWVDDFSGNVKSLSTGRAYMNFVTRSTDTRVKAFYGAENYTRLQRVKAQYDPQDIFHLNPNIKPA
jgi:hypothetical protein